MGYRVFTIKTRQAGATATKDRISSEEIQQASVAERRRTELLVIRRYPAQLASRFKKKIGPPHRLRLPVFQRRRSKIQHLTNAIPKLQSIDQSVHPLYFDTSSRPCRTRNPGREKRGRALRHSKLSVVRFCNTRTFCSTDCGGRNILLSHSTM